MVITCSADSVTPCIKCERMLGNHSLGWEQNYIQAHERLQHESCHGHMNAVDFKMRYGLQ